MVDIAYPHVAERIFGRAHAIEPEAFRAIVESPVARRILAGQGEQPAGKKKHKSQPSATEIRRERLAATVDGEWCREGGEYFLTRDGVAIVPVCGLLSLRYDWMAALCGWTTYEGLTATFDAIGSDDRARAVLMDVESPGGEAAGMIDVADKIIAMRGRKRVWAVANAYAFSAAYAVAGSAERLLVPRLCQVGSIGAVAIHLDQSAFDASMGLKYTAIYSGARKIDGWNHAPLSDDAQAAMQESIDYCRDQFAELVGRQGRISTKEAKATEAGVYHDQPAVEAGLADGVASFEDALSELSDFAAGRPRSATAVASITASIEEPAMAETKKAAEVTASNAPAQPENKDTVTTPAAPAAAAPAAPAAVTTDPKVVETAASTHAAHHKCGQCGHEWDDEEDPKKMDDEDAKASAAILDLCASQGLTAARAKKFIDAKVPLDKVRAEIAADKAKASDQHNIDPAKSENPAATKSSWDKAIAKLPGFRAK